MGVSKKSAEQAESNPKVDSYLTRAKKWQAEMGKLREILLGCGLTEELRWGKPCYTLEGKNVVLIVGFKGYCALLFCKGALLKDDRGLLIKPGEQTQATRQMRFTELREILKVESILMSYVLEARKVEEAGLEVTYKKISEFVIPEEFRKKLDDAPVLKKAFKSLTPGRQRGYLIYISSAKRSETRQSRVEKCSPRILAGKGLDD